MVEKHEEYEYCWGEAYDLMSGVLKYSMALMNEEKSHVLDSYSSDESFDWSEHKFMTQSAPALLETNENEEDSTRDHGRNCVIS